jgi:exopolysaccharide production protein ExoZ
MMNVALIGLSIAGLGSPSENPLLFTYTDPILLEFLAGIWLAVLWRSGGLGLNAGAPLLAAAGAGFAAATYFSADPKGWVRLLVWGAPSWMLVAGCLALEPKMPKSRLGLALGDSSYATYLFHSFITNAVWRLPLGLAVIPASLAASAAGGWVIFRFLETRLTRLLRRKTPARAPAAAAPSTT